MQGKSRTGAKARSGAMRVFAGFFDPAPNSVYGSFDLAQSIMEMGMDGVSAESRSKPSPDVILRRLYEVDEESARRELEEFNEWILDELYSSKDLMIAIDFTVIPYYGEENPALVSDSRLPGTNLGIKFAVLSVVEEGKTFTLKTRQVYPIESEVSVLGEMLDYAESLLDPTKVLLDRGFYSVKMIKELKSRSMGFIMPAKKTNPVKKACKKFKKGEAPSELDYTVSGSKGEEDVRLLLTEKEIASLIVPMPMEIAFFGTSDFNSKNLALSSLVFSDSSTILVLESKDDPGSLKFLRNQARVSGTDQGFLSETIG